MFGDYIDQLGARWASLQARERLAVAAAGATVLIAILVLGVIDPINASRSQLRAEVDALAQDLDWMRSVSGRLGGAGAAVAEGNVLSLVDASAQRNGLRGAVRRLQPEGERGVRVQLDDASFDAVVLMLGELRDQGVELEQLSLRRERDGAGLVDGSLSLRAR